MANAISPIKRQVTKPYLSLLEFKNAPTALDYGNLVVGGNAQAQDAELTNAIYRASSWIDQYCGQVLSATVDQEQQRTRIKADGTLRIHPKYAPIVALTGLSYGATPNQMVTATDPSQAWLEEQSIVFPYAQLSSTMSSQGPLSFGFPGTPGREVYVNYTYVNGWANTALASAATAGATSITVSDATGITPGESMTLFDGASTERVTVDPSYAFGSTTVLLSAALLFAHPVATTFSALPAAVKEACIVMTSAFLKIRGDASLTLAMTTRPSGNGSSGLIGTESGIASEILKPFRRIR